MTPLRTFQAIGARTVDALNSTATDQPLSAAKGKQINETLISLSSQNFIINGGLSVWQRGTSFSFAAGDSLKYFADRFMFGSPASSSISRSTDVPANVRCDYSAKIHVDGTEMVESLVRQRIEHGLIHPDFTYTYLVWVKGPVGSTITIDISDKMGFGRVLMAEQWQTLQATGKPTGYSYATTSYSATDIQFKGYGDFYFTAVQVIPGELSIPFMPRRLSEEQRLCWRYSLVIPSGLTFRASLVNSLDTIIFLIPIPTAPMRTTPTIASGTFHVCPMGSYTPVSGFTFYIAGTTLNGIRIYATKANHGLTDAWLLTETAVFLDAEFY
jgi:hypothetical protein